MMQKLELPSDIFLPQDAFEERSVAFLEKNGAENTAFITIQVNNLELISDAYGRIVSENIMQILGAQISLHLEECGFFTSYKKTSFTIIRTYSDRISLSNWVSHLESHVKSQMRLAKYITEIDITVGIYAPENKVDESVSDMVAHSETAIKYSRNSNEQIIFYEDEMRLRLLKEYELIKSMDEALRNDEFCIFLQPQHYLQQGDRVLSAEALARWIKRDGTVIYPGEFIPAFEKNGLIAKLDRHIMELACRFISEHISEEWYNNIAISVNVSQVDLSADDFIDYYRRTKEKYNIPDGLIEIEFTESAVFDDYRTFSKIMTELEKSGFTCSLDDFGAGSSSLNMLKEMPVNVLKMDRLFFVNRGVNDKKRNDAVIASVVAMARGLGIKIIAEGIESPEQISYLRKIGCDVIQGYVYSKPLPTDEFVEYVKNFVPGNEKADETESFPEKPYTGLTREALCRKYEELLRYVNSIVMELDIENDFFTVISNTDNGIRVPFSKGRYSDFLGRYMPLIVQPEHLPSVMEKASLKSILLSFYRGDDRLSCEFLAKLPDGKEDDYRWMAFDVHFDELMREKTPVATIFIHNIQEQKQREQDIRLANMHLSTALHGINGIIYEYNLDNDRIELLHNASGFPAHEFVSDDHRDEFNSFINRHVHPDDADKMRSLFKLDLIACSRNEEITRLCEFRRIYSNGKMTWKSLSCVRSPQGNNLTFILQDITEQKNHIEKIKETEQQVFSLVSSTFRTITEFNRHSRLLHTIVGNEAFEKSGINANGTLEEFYHSLGESPVIHPNDRLYLLERLSPKSLIEETKREPLINFKFRVCSNKTEWYELSIIKTKKPGISLCSLKLIDDARAMLDDNSNLDHITGLNSADAYRKGIFERFRYGSGSSVKNTLIIIDIDNFNEINVKKGRVYGDVILRRLASAIRKEAPDAFSARIGGDEFAVILENTDTRFAYQLVKSIRKRFLGDADENVTFSAGISEIAPDGNIRELHNEALSCITRAREKGGNTTEIFDSRSDSNEADINVSEVEIRGDSIIAADIFQRVYLFLSNCEDALESLPHALGLVCSEFDISHAFIYRITDERYNLEFVSQWFEESSLSSKNTDRKHTLMDFLCCDESNVNKLINRKWLDAYKHAKDNPKMLDYYQKNGILASLICPCAFRGRICSFIGFDEHTASRTWSETELTQLSLVADLIGKTVEREYLIRKKEVQSDE